MTRLDIYMTEKGLAASREKAKRLIIGGKVAVNGGICLKPARSVGDGDDISVTENFRYVGRGALKLVKAFEVFDIDVRGKVCADIGASTGGFTQVLLERGAELVYAVDVGHGQLARELADDPRVVNCEGVNIRYTSPDRFGGKVGFICCDLSFISLRQTLFPMASVLAEGGDLAALIKPQFEAGRGALGKNGVLKDRKKHEEILNSLIEFFPQAGLSLCGLDFSPICGGDGNIEYLAHLVRSSEPPKSFDVKRTVAAAFESAKQW